MGGGAYGSNQTNFIFHVSILVVFVFDRYGLLTNGISYPKFWFVGFDEKGEDALVYDIICDNWWAFCELPMLENSFDNVFK